MNSFRVWAILFTCCTTAILPATYARELPPSAASQNQAPHAFIPVTQVGDLEAADQAPIEVAYLRFNILPSLRGNWQWAVRNHDGNLPGDARHIVAQFRLTNDGGLESASVVESSNDSALDGTVLEAIRRSAPFPALPTELNGKTVTLQCHFFYRAGKLIRFNEGRNTTSGDQSARAIDGLVPPRAIYNPPAPYTDAARRAKLNGEVLLTVTVSPGGDVTDIKVDKSLDKGLDESAVQTVRTWKFEPATRDGNPVQYDVHVEVTFRIR